MFFIQTATLNQFQSSGPMQISLGPMLAPQTVVVYRSCAPRSLGVRFAKNSVNGLFLLFQPVLTEPYVDMFSKVHVSCVKRGFQCMENR